MSICGILPLYLPPPPDPPLLPPVLDPLPLVDPDELEPPPPGVLPAPGRPLVPVSLPIPFSPPGRFFPVSMVPLPLCPPDMLGSVGLLDIPPPELPLVAPPPVLPPLPVPCAISTGCEVVKAAAESEACALPTVHISPAATAASDMNSFRFMVIPLCLVNNDVILLMMCAMGSSCV